MFAVRILRVLLTREGRWTDDAPFSMSTTVVSEHSDIGICLWDGRVVGLCAIIRFFETNTRGSEFYSVLRIGGSRKMLKHLSMKYFKLIIACVDI